MDAAKKEAMKAKFIRLAKKGQALERAWDRAVAAGDQEKMKELDSMTESFYRAWDKYEDMGIRLRGVRIYRWDGSVRRILITASE